MTIPDHGMSSALAAALAAMPDPVGASQVSQYEKGLAHHFGVPHAVAVASGTAALHCALAACGIGSGDEVLVPALSVVMSVAPVLYAGARPVFVDCAPSGADFNYEHLAANLTRRTKAIIPVHLWGRAGDLVRLADFAAARGLRLIEDACQAHGTRVGGRQAGTFGDFGCFSTKDGKLLWSGEGGFVLTRDADLAERCRALRTHWQTPPAGEAPLARLGFNYRLAEPLAAIARANLARFDQLLALRQHQTSLLATLLADVPGVDVLTSAQGWNGYALLARISLRHPRGFCEHLDTLGVANSLGTYRLTPCDQRPMFASFSREPCPAAASFIEALLAVVMTEHDDDECIHRYAHIISQEASRWADRY
jgi:perosamine synthetase